MCHLAWVRCHVTLAPPVHTALNRLEVQQAAFNVQPVSSRLYLEKQHVTHVQSEQQQREEEHRHVHHVHKDNIKTSQGHNSVCHVHPVKCNLRQDSPYATFVWLVRSSRPVVVPFARLAPPAQWPHSTVLHHVPRAWPAMPSRSL